MTHEFKTLVDTAYAWQSNGAKVLLATVVKLEGSSYRRPGVRMIISNAGEMKGTLSGGCVEKEVLRQAQSVFKDGIPKVMTYDGRFRLGCEGMLYILLEPIHFSEKVNQTLQNQFVKRKPFTCDSYFQVQEGDSQAMGSVITIEGAAYLLNSSFSIKNVERLQKFSQKYDPIFQLYIFGAEHDAVQLCRMAHHIGWEVHIIAPPDEEKTIDYFEGATTLTTPLLNSIDTSGMDKNTAVVLMSHSLHKDVQYLLALKDVNPTYIGLLGPKHRRERLFSEFLNVYPETPYEFFETIHGPAGIDIGAISASEIAVSILAEILSVVRKSALQPLRDKSGSIHE